MTALERLARRVLVLWVIGLSGLLGGSAVIGVVIASVAVILGATWPFEPAAALPFFGRWIGLAGLWAVSILPLIFWEARDR